MRKWICIGMLILSGCSAKVEVQKLSAEAAKEKMSADVVILDVRTREEYASGHIEQAINLPVENISEIEDTISEKEKEIFVYCRSGNRSAKASAQLIDMGYTKVYDFGGIQDWPYDIVK